MEVHHHTHSPRKKWKHYFWEFFMLFLAVSLGFFVENQREHFIEHKREKQYIRSLIEDIKTDTAKIQTIIKDYQDKLPRTDSLLEYFTELMHGYSSGFMRNLSATLEFIDFFPTDRTIQQLKNAGGLRLIRNQAASDSIMNYDLLMKDVLLEQENMVSTHFKKIWDANIALFDTYKIDSLLSNMPRKEIEKEKPLILLTSNRQDLVQYYTRLKALKGNFNYFIDVLQSMKKAGTGLIIFLKEEYRLK